MDEQGIIRYNKECNFTLQIENNNFENKIKTALKKDKFVQQILKNISNYSSFKK